MRAPDPYRGRHRRQAAVFAVLFVAVLGVGVAAGGVWFGAWEWPGGARQASATTSPTPTADPCPPPVTELPPPPEVRVAVLNSTSRSGLAGRTADELTARGYVVTAVGNAEEDVVEPAQVRYGPAGRAPAVAAWALVPGAALVEDARTGPEVDLVLGDAFSALTPAGAVPAELPALPVPPGCAPPA